MGRPIILIGSIGTGPIDLFWNLGSALITHWPYFCGSGQLTNGSTRPISIHTNMPSQHKHQFLNNFIKRYKIQPLKTTHSPDILLKSLILHDILFIFFPTGMLTPFTATPWHLAVVARNNLCGLSSVHVEIKISNPPRRPMSVDGIIRVCKGCLE